MACLNERIVGAVCLLLSGYALADGPLAAPPEEMTVASIAPLPMEVVSAIPGPQTYLHRYEFQYQAAQRAPFDAQLQNFYSVQIDHDFRLGSESFSPTPGVARPQQPSAYLRMGQSTAPALALTEIPNATLTIGAQPQRRLSLTVNDWVFSGTARVAILHSRSTGATLNVRHGF
ncbi:hypothetical protein LMG28688_02200 [Paraburkholderia caffeinitolerans]|uniref:Uncharacterized protein n=1 Tax=Paraburkholderia caffeinitolerans TaxID=1723730 RepID=A0A6J5FXI8_9BURK|nr:hypothetical protein [Paraburkholderia caffeinitolerans]CAB3786065.1 hypothetical protein LMG28688_02200 [Paraburkholderia caffeinitolerans]